MIIINCIILYAVILFEVVIIALFSLVFDEYEEIINKSSFFGLFYSTYNRK